MNPREKAEPRIALLKAQNWIVPADRIEFVWASAYPGEGIARIYGTSTDEGEHTCKATSLLIYSNGVVRPGGLADKIPHIVKHEFATLEEAVNYANALFALGELDI